MNVPLIVSAGMLVRAALLDRPYGYSSYPRLVVCGTSVYIALSPGEQRRQGSMWTIIGVAILFNLLTPIALNGRAPQKAGGKYLLSGGLLICPACGGHFDSFIPPWKPRRGLLLRHTQTKAGGVHEHTDAPDAGDGRDDFSR